MRIISLDNAKQKSQTQIENLQNVSDFLLFNVYCFCAYLLKAYFLIYSYRIGKVKAIGAVFRNL